jgi:hypothetical protein
MAESYFYGTGRRKSAVARVFMKRGNGVIVVNGKPIDQFFSRETGRMIVRQPLELVEQLAGFDIKVNVDRWRRVRPSRCCSPRYYPRLDRIRCSAEARTVQGWFCYPRCS